MRDGRLNLDPIYLDHNASTPVLPRVREAMMQALDEGFGNPSAGHVYGRRARAIVERARAQVAELLGASPDEIVFTGGGTEANNLALRGLRRSASPAALITSTVEHPAIREPADLLARAGAVVMMIGVNRDGVVDPDDVLLARSFALDEAPLISVLLAQNETGVLQPVADIARRARKQGAIVHTDAAQAVGKIDVDVHRLQVDLLSLAGHKLYAPKGTGALFVRRGIELDPVVVGAKHERGLRPGTENVAGIAGLGAACAIARADLATEWSRQRALRDTLEARLGTAGFVVHGAGADRLPNTVNGRFPGVRGATLVARAEAVAFTTGSACHAGVERPSRVLLEMGIAPEDALGAVRLSLGRGTREEDVERAAAFLIAAARG